MLPASSTQVRHQDLGVNAGEERLGLHLIPEWPRYTLYPRATFSSRAALASGLNFPIVYILSCLAISRFYRIDLHYTPQTSALETSCFDLQGQQAD